jgi:hypothetical protein
LRGKRVAMRVLIGIDDTDNAESRGTGYLSRMMAAVITDSGLGVVTGITRHQLLLDDRIPYTSQNSSACLDSEVDNINKIYDLCASFIKENIADGSDAGLCIAHEDFISEEIQRFGQRAKEEVLTLPEAKVIAESNQLMLEGFSGDHGGMIGALAAVGLRAGGNDGRYIWLQAKKELRDIRPGTYPLGELLSEFRIDRIECEGEVVTDKNCNIYLGDWVRPVLREQKVCLIVEKVNGSESYDFKVASKEHIRSLS